MAEVKKSFAISLDTKTALYHKPFEVVEGDTGNQIVITLTDDGVPVDLSTCRVAAVFATPNGTVEQDSWAAGGGVTLGGDDDNVITIDLFATSFGVGKNHCELQVYSGTSYTTLVTSAQFNFTGKRAIMNDDTILAVPTYPVLVEALARVEALEDREQADWDEADNTKGTFIENKPVIGTDIQAPTNTLDAEATLSDTDTVPFYDASATAHRKSTWANIVAKIRTAFFGSVTGVAKLDGAGNISAAAANTDFAAATHASRHASGAADEIDPANLGTYGVAELNSDGVVKPSQARALVQLKYSSFTLGEADAEKLTLLTSTSAIVVTIPLDSTYNFPVGTAFNFIRWNTGTTSFAATSGIGWQAVGSITAISATSSSALLVKVAANTWWLSCG